MYKDLSGYADIANSIKPDIDAGYESKFYGRANTPIAAGLSDYIEAGKKLNFRTRLEAADDITFSTDGEDENGRDGFDRFLTGEFRGLSYPTIPDEDDDDTEWDDKTKDMINAIGDYDPNGSISHSEWLSDVSEKYNSAQKNRFERKIQNRVGKPEDDDTKQLKDNEFDDTASKHQMSDRIHGKIVDVIKSMASNKKLAEKISDINTPAGYIDKSIDAFVSRAMPEDTVELREHIAQAIRSDLKASNGDITQLFDLYK